MSGNNKRSRTLVPGVLAPEPTPEPAAHASRMRRFQLLRTEDVSGTSGTGVVAEGVEFSNGKCAVTWLSPYWVGAFYENAKAVESVHGHGGKTKIVFIDSEDGSKN